MHACELLLLHPQNALAKCAFGSQYGWQNRSNHTFWLAHGAQCQGLYRCCGGREAACYRSTRQARPTCSCDETTHTESHDFARTVPSPHNRSLAPNRRLAPLTTCRTNYLCAECAGTPGCRFCDFTFHSLASTCMDASDARSCHRSALRDSPTQCTAAHNS